MVDALRIDATKIEMRNADNEIVYSTDLNTINLVPQSELAGSVSVNFPSFTRDSALYLYSRGSREGNGGAPFAESCATYAHIPAQEWGPGRANNLSRSLLGSLPSGADYVDVQVRLTQTNAPENFLGFPLVKSVAEGQWISLADNCCILEQKGAVKRMIAFEVIDGQVYLSRFQSAAAQAVAFIEAKTDLSVSYTPADPPFPETVFWQHGQGDSLPCSTSLTHDMSSDWTVEYKIIPGNIGVSPAGNRLIVMPVDVRPSDVNSSTHTITGVNFGPEAADRKIVFAVAARRNTTSGARDISSVTIGGVSATLVQKTDLFNGTIGANVCVGMYIASVPTGTSGTITVVYTAAMPISRVYVFAIYNSLSATPIDTDSTLGTGAITLSAAPGGYTIAVADASTINGLDEIYVLAPYGNISDPAPNAPAGLAYNETSSIALDCPINRALVVATFS
jgi:hypothetical protein